MHDIFEQHHWKPLERFGLTGDIWSLNSETIIFTWIVLGILLIVSITGRYFLNKKDNNTISFVITTALKSLIDLVTQTIGKFSYNYFAFISSMFIFILTSNIISLIPWIEEPTKDPSTTIGLAVTSFLYVQISGIRVNGFWGHFKEFFEPIFLLFPIHVVGEFARIISMSFRLFGNIFGGAIISSLWTQAIAGSLFTETLGIISGVNLIVVAFFVLFEGFIQAFVFSTLSLTYLSLAVTREHSEESH